MSDYVPLPGNRPPTGQRFNSRTRARGGRPNLRGGPSAGAAEKAARDAQNARRAQADLSRAAARAEKRLAATTPPLDGPCEWSDPWTCVNPNHDHGATS